MRGRRRGAGGNDQHHRDSLDDDHDTVSLPISDSSAQTPPRSPARESELSISERAEKIESVIERLQELVGSGTVDEPDLSHDSLMINSQAQEDELLVIESIYGDKVLKLDKQNGLRTFQVHVEIEAYSEISVTAKLDSFDQKPPAGSSENAEDFSYTFKVRHLPPIMLTCTLPKSYPSHRPPYFTISTEWLDPIKASKLCSMLDSIWNEQSGQEVIYQWVEWLSNSALSYLGFHAEIMLGPYGIRHVEDKRAISVIVSPDIDIRLIRRYNDERLLMNFQQNLHECPICFNEYPGAEFARLPCNHYFCWKCMKTFSDIHVSEGTTNNLHCPETKCGSMIPPSMLKRLLGQEEYERWESLTLEKTLESMSDIVYCPRCNMPCIEEEDEHSQCFKCFFSFCTICRERRHIGKECIPSEEKLQFLQERQNSSQLNEEQRRKELEMINNFKSVKAILRDAKQCPNCQMAISRTEGCNKMVCRNCGQYFCYRCSKAINGYDHFGSEGCELFPRETILEWEHMNPGQVLALLGDDEPVRGQGQGLDCPYCLQFNVKNGINNHLYCRACKSNYCYMCKQIFWLGCQHYGPNKRCQQYTYG